MTSVDGEVISVVVEIILATRARHSPTVLSESPVKAEISMVAIVLTLR